jgi:hypothetical protein
MMSTLSKYSNSFLTVLMLVIFTGMLIIASRYPAGARFMPYVLGFPAVALCLLQLFLDARERRRTNQAEGPTDVELAEAQVSRAVGHAVHFDVGDLLAPEASLDPDERIGREAIAWGYFLAFIAGIVFFGFHLAVPVFLIAFLRFRAKASWLMTLGLTAAACFVLFFAFEQLLHIELHKGFITERILDSISG